MPNVLLNAPPPGQLPPDINDDNHEDDRCRKRPDDPLDFLELRPEKISGYSQSGNPDGRTCRRPDKEPHHAHFSETGGNGDYCTYAGPHARYKNERRSRANGQSVKLTMPTDCTTNARE